MDVYLDYARRGLNAWWRYLVTIVLALVIWIVLDVLIVFGLTVSRLMPANVAAELTRPTHPMIFFGANGLAFATIVAGFVIAARLVQHKRFVDIIGEWRWRRFAAGAGVWTVCIAATILADVILRPGGFRWSATAATAGLAVAAAVGLGVQTFAEEFVFRGYLTQGLLLATRRPLVAAVLSGLAFGALHIPNGIPQALNAVLFGVVAALIAIRTGGIAFTYGMHLINNLFGAVIVVSAGDVFNGAPALISQSTPGLVWWDLIAGAAVLAVPAWIVLRPRPDSRGGIASALD
ncbi:MAG TPA: type II CAAX endopeptidase family protein [Caulobacteraceae bacterium]|jgi:membrane protease YdiL (CAAX protease family)|nr:type II CAAX endopeptidase family protein [Caulobacteraceae bacterium]